MDAAERLSRTFSPAACPRRRHLAPSRNSRTDHRLVEGDGWSRDRSAAGVRHLANAGDGRRRRSPTEAGGQHPGTDAARSRLSGPGADRDHSRRRHGRTISHDPGRRPCRRGLHCAARSCHRPGGHGSRGAGRHHHPARSARVYGPHAARPLSEPRTTGFSTRATHAGQPPDPATGAVNIPIYQTSTFAQEAVGKHRGYEYARTGNPTRTALEQCIAALEGGAHGLAFASGMAAESAVMQLLKPGDHTVSMDDVYGGAYRLFPRVAEPMGLTFSFVDCSDLQAVERAVTDRTRMVWVESPTNPLLKLVDIEAVSKMAHAHKALVVVDNTLMSPYFQRPLSLGADIVVHSATKYLG